MSIGSRRRDRAAELGTNAHRFSSEWSRVEPERAQIDSAALDHYLKMIDAMRARGIEPMITLHHFTNPLWIEETGGWLNPETVRRFTRFARLIAEEFSPMVRLWCTINEPLVYATHSYLFGRWPPGYTSMGKTYTVAENLLRAQTIKEVRPDAQVGCAKNQISLKTAFPALIHARARNTVRHFFNEAWVEALATGVLRFPFHKAAVPEARDTLDWIGLNYYYRYRVAFSLLRPRGLFIHRTTPRDGIQGPDSVGEIWPEGLMEHIKWLYKATGKPIYITENGLPDPDDTVRPLHMVRSIRCLWEAINYNYPVKGYFYWSLVDNFEWAEGYDPRFSFGLFACDHETQTRTPRPSAGLYGSICKANGLASDAMRRYVPDQADAMFPSVELQTEVELPANQEAW